MNRTFFSIARYVLGLAILGYVFILLPLATHNSPMILLVNALVPPFCFFVLPTVLIAGYFLFTSKFRWRFDILALMLAIVILSFLTKIAFP